MPNDFIVEGILSAIIIVTIVILFFVFTPEGSLLEGILSTILIVTIVILFFVFTPEGSLLEGVLSTILIVTIVILFLDLTIDIQNTKIFNHYLKATPNETNSFNATKILANLTH